MIDTALRVRVNRLLSDDFRIEDLTALFLALRERVMGWIPLSKLANLSHTETNEIAVSSLRQHAIFLFFFETATYRLLSMSRTCRVIFQRRCKS